MLNMYQFLLIMDLILAKIPSRDAFPSDNYIIKKESSIIHRNNLILSF